MCKEVEDRREGLGHTDTLETEEWLHGYRPVLLPLFFRFGSRSCRVHRRWVPFHYRKGTGKCRLSLTFVYSGTFHSLQGASVFSDVSTESALDEIRVGQVVSSVLGVYRRLGNVPLVTLVSVRYSHFVCVPKFHTFSCVL